MKILKYLIFFCAFVSFGQIPTSRSQVINRITFLITDSVTKKPIVGALVSCKARLTYTIATKTDSIYIEMQNYYSKKIRIEDAQNRQIQLRKKKLKTSDYKKTNNIKKIKHSTINIANVKHYVGFPNPFNPLPYQQVAQLFQNTAELYILDKITIAQLFFPNLKLVESEEGWIIYNNAHALDPSYNLSNTREYSYNDLQSAIFRIRIYRASDAGYPDEDLCNEEINVTAENSDKIVANLSKYKIIVPKGDFFVAIQWLPNIDNASQITYKTFSTTKFTGFKPFVGIEPSKDKDTTFFVKDYSGNWQKSQDKGKLAIALTGRTE